MAETYRNNQIIVRYDPTICTHSANCVKTLPSVFDVNRKPWVDVNGADTASVIKTVTACPSGALTYEIIS